MGSGIGLRTGVVDVLSVEVREDRQRQNKKERRREKIKKRLASQQNTQKLKMLVRQLMLRELSVRSCVSFGRKNLKGVFVFVCLFSQLVSFLKKKKNKTGRR